MQTRDDAVVAGKCAAGKAGNQACNLQTAIGHAPEIFGLLGILLKVVVAKPIQRQHHDDGCSRLALDISNAHCGISQQRKGQQTVDK